MSATTAERRQTTRFALAGATYVVVIVAGGAAADLLDPQPAWLGPLIAFAALVPAGYMVLAGPLRLRTKEGVERDVLYRSAALAFFVTMLVVLTAGLLEAFAGLTSSAWWYWGVGMATWGVAAVVMQRRLS